MNRESGSEQNQPAEVHQGYPRYPELPYHDELSLADLVRALGRRWRWIVGSVVLALVLAITYIVVTADTYAYSLEVTVGQKPHDQAESGFRPIAAPETVVAALKRSYIPAAIRAARAKHGASEDSDYVPDIKVDSPDGSLIVSMTVDAAQRRDPLVSEILGHAAAALLTDHAQSLAAVLEGQRRHLDRLQSRLTATEARLQTLAERRDALKDLARQSQAAALSAGTELSAVLSERGRLLEKQADLRESIEQVRDKVAVLERGVDTFGNAKVNKSALQAQRKAAAEIQQAFSIQPTRVMALPTRSPEPVGIGGAVILALAVVLGVGGGVVLALLVDAVRRDSQYG